MRISLILILFLIGCISIMTCKTNSYKILDIDTNIFWDCNIIILQDISLMNSSVCDIVLITSKLNSFKKLDSSYIKIELNMVVKLNLKNDDRYKSKRKSDKTRLCSIYSTFPRDSLLPYAYGWYPCIKIIWDKDNFTDKVNFCDEIIDLYYKKE